jgi:hypothetical protein
MYEIFFVLNELIFSFFFLIQLNNETFSHVIQSSSEINDDTKSENSIEYDYTNPLSLSITNNIQHRHVSIATIYLQDEQWVKIELLSRKIIITEF